MNKYEQLIEHIINDEQDKARALFHKIVVEKSRDIYESLIDEEDLQEVGGNEVEGLVRDVTADEEGIAEADMDDEGAEGPDMDMDDMDMDDGMGDEEDHHADVGGDEGLEDRVMDLEDALDELKAEFDSLMAGGDDSDMMGGDESDMMGGEDDDAMRMMEEEEDDEEELDESKEEEEDDEEELDENMVREYVEKVSATSQGSEGHEVAKGGSANVNKQSIVAGKNDMGGSAKNLVRGDSNPAPDGQRAQGKASGFVKPAQEMDLGKRNVNKPGGNKGAQNWYGKKETSWEKSHGKEGQTTDGKMSVDTKSLVGGKVR